MIFLTDVIAKILSFVVSMMPKWLRWKIAQFLAWLWWDFFKIRRFTVYRNISIVFPNKDKQQKSKLAKQSLINMCYSFIEFLTIPSLTQRKVDANLVIHDQHIYEQALAKNKGALVVSLHLGAGDYGLAQLAFKKIYLNVISKKFKNKALNQFWFGVREKLGNRFIDPHGPTTAFDILKACKRNEGVVFVIDQFMGKPYGISSTFFGKKTGTAYGLALFAMKTKAPVLPLYTYRDSELRTHIVFGPEIQVDLDSVTDRDLQISLMTQEYNSVLEKIILQYPEHWMWVHRRWKTWE